MKFRDLRLTGIKMVLLCGIIGLPLVACEDVASPHDQLEPDFDTVVQEAPEAVEEAVGAALRHCARLGIIASEGLCADYETAIKGLANARLAYNRPVFMTRGVTQEISLVIDLGQQGELAAELSGLTGEVIQATTKVARHMSAELRGVAFAIEPVGPQRRLATAAAPVQWSWAVKPNKEGPQLLILELNAHIVFEGTVSSGIKIRTFRDEIIIEVGTWDRITQIATEIKPIHALGAAMIGSGWGLIVWWQRRRTKKICLESKSDDNKK